MKTITLIFTLIFSVIFVNAQDVIYKNDGTEIKAKIMELTTEAIKYKNFEQLEGPTRNILLTEVYMIIYEDGTREVIKGTSQSNEDESEKKEIIIQVPQNNSQTEDNESKKEELENMSFGDKCMLGTSDADNLHGKEGAHFCYGIAFGPFAVIGAAVSTPTPEKGSSTPLMSQNKELFTDPAYRTCYTKKARKKNVGNTAAGWATWVLVLILIGSSY